VHRIMTRINNNDARKIKVEDTGNFENGIMCDANTPALILLAVVRSAKESAVKTVYAKVS